MATIEFSNNSNSYLSIYFATLKDSLDTAIFKQSHATLRSFEFIALNIPTLEIENISLIFLGSFNPGIFQPAWFVSEKLLMKGEGQSSEIDIIQSDFCSFKTERFSFLCDAQRLQLVTVLSSASDQIRDLAISILQLLPHIPIRKMGINRNLHYSVADSDVWHHIGDKLAPKDIWKDLLTKPGLMSLELQGVRKDSFEGYKQIRVASSTEVAQGVYFRVNDHYSFDDLAPKAGNESARRILSKSFTQSLKESQEIVNSIFKRL